MYFIVLFLIISIYVYYVEYYIHIHYTFSYVVQHHIVLLYNYVLYKSMNIYVYR